MHALAAVLANSDRQFEAIAVERRRYITRLNHPRTKLSTILSEETNRESIVAYLRKRFPGKDLAASDRHLEMVLNDIDFSKYPTLADLERVVSATEKVRRTYKHRSYKGTAAAHLALALSCVDPAYRRASGTSAAARAVISQFNKSGSKRRSSGRRAG